MKGRDRQTIHFFNLPDLKCVQAVRGIDVTNGFPRHVHNGFCIGMVWNGSRVIYQGRASVTIPENGLFVINPGVSHACKPQCDRHSYLSICVEMECMKKVASQILGKERAVPHFRDVLVRDTALGSKIRRFLSLVENASSTMEKESVLNSLISSLILRYGNGPPIPFQAHLHGDVIESACQFIEANYAQDLSLKQLAEAAHLSPFYFQRLFLGRMGISPHDYLIQYRVTQARGLLSEGHGIAEVALDTGFVDQSHFTRSFKRVMGIAPGAYVRGGML